LTRLKIYDSGTVISSTDLHYVTDVITGEVNWVQCDKCEEWFHLLCVGLAEDEVSEEEEYECFKCKQGRGEQAVLIPNLPSPTKALPAMYGVGSFGGVSVIKQNTEIDSLLLCNEDRDVSVESRDVSMYTNSADSNSAYAPSLLDQKSNSGMSSLSKLTQFSYETDESSQDEVKSAYSIGGNSVDSHSEQIGAEINMSTEVS